MWPFVVVAVPPAVKCLLCLLRGLLTFNFSQYHTDMTRYTLSDAQWAAIEPLCPGKKADPGKTAKDNRLFLEAVLWIVRTGSPWRDLPQEFGNWNSVYRRYRRWVQLDVFKNIFTHLNTDADYEYTMIDGTIVKTHRHGQGAKGGRSNRQSADPKAG